VNDMIANEKLAAYAHEAWAGWMRHLFEQCLDDGVVGIADRASVVIPPDLVARWKRQMNTPYEELPENEKESDRAEAIKIQTIFFGEGDDEQR